MSEIIRQLSALGIDAIKPVEVKGELRFKSRALDRLGPSELNRIMFDAYDAGRLSRSPFSIYVDAA